MAVPFGSAAGRGFHSDDDDFWLAGPSSQPDRYCFLGPHEPNKVLAQDAQREQVRASVTRAKQQRSAFTAGIEYV